MKKFLLKCTRIVTIFIVTLLIIFLIIYLSNRKFSNFRIDKNYKTIVVGHSHSECAFNDRLIPNLVNFSESGESYFYTYFKVKKLIDQNSHINKMLIEFSNNQITKRMDDWIWQDNFMCYRFPRYAAFMDFDSFYLLYKKNPKCFYQSIPSIIKNYFSMVIKGLNYTNEIGGFLSLKKDLSHSIISNHITHNQSRKKDLKNISKENLLYLNKIISYCTKKGIKAFLIRSPKHENYGGFQNEETFQYLLSKKFSDIEFLDFSKFPLSNNKFADFQHLNHEGAKEFSLWFATLQEKGLFMNRDKQNLIDSEIKAFCIAAKE